MGRTKGFLAGMAIVVSVLVAIPELGGHMPKELEESRRTIAFPVRPEISDAGIHAQPGVSAKIRIEEGYGRLPLCFIENREQVDPRVKFYEMGRGHSTFFTPDGVVLSLTAEEEKPDRIGSPGTGGTPSPKGLPKSDVVRLIPVGMNKDVQIVAEDPLEGKMNFFVGNDPGKWRSGVRTYGAVVYREAYPGIDVKFYGNNRQMEYDVIVKPGADPSRVKFAYSGADKVEVTDSGDLSVQLGGDHSLIQRRPVVYQIVDGKRISVDGRFKVERSIPEAESGRSGRIYTCSFEVASYDAASTLVIDPKLVYSTYFGGSGGEYGDRANGIAVDGSGNAYVTGYSYSTDLPTQNPFQSTNKSTGYCTAFVTKLSPDGKSLVYSTYLGGSQIDVASGIAVDASGSAYVTGVTYSTDFPIANAFQGVNNNSANTAFLTKLSPDGKSLIYSTYLGGTGLRGDSASGIAVDASGSAYVAGYTTSTDFPTLNPVQSANKGSGYPNAFVAKFSPDGKSLAYSTYLGGTGTIGDAATGIAVDGAGSACVVGYTSSTDFPTKNAFQNASKASGHNCNGFVTKLSPDGKSLAYSTYLGGTGSSGDGASGIAMDGAGSAYVVGYTSSTDFPTKNAFQNAPKASGYNYNGFVSKLSVDGKTLVYSTYLGGTSSNNVNGIAVDASGSAYVTGSTNSTDFPTVNPFQAALNTSSNSAFLTQFSQDGASLICSSYFGGSGDNEAYSIALDGSGNIYVTGMTGSTDFPIATPFLAHNPNSSGDTIFIAKLNLTGASGWLPYAASLTSPTGATSTGTPTYTWSAVSNATWYGLWVNDSTGNRIDSWYTAAQANCAGGSGSCTATPNIPLDNGAASWWIQTYNSYGYGPWSTRMDFTVSGSSYGPPVAATLTAPTGAISTGTPTYTWSAVSNATWYGLWVNDGTGNRIDSWYTAAQANCAGGSGSCTATPNIPLDNGAASWWIQTYNSYGYGPWSTRMDFTVSGSSYGPPVAATLTAPTGAISTGTPTYTWSAVSNATWYGLWVNDGTGNRIDSWYTAAQANCAGGSGSCTATPNIPLDNGAASWWIQTYNSYGYGPWSTRMDFTVSGSSYGPPVAATLTAPTGAISTGTPTYTWSAVSNATWYGLWVNDGTGNRIDSWYTAAQANCAGGSGSCTATPNIPLDNGAASWWIQTYNSYGYGPWSTRMDFTVSGSSYGPPVAATLTAPTGAISTGTPTYTWSAVSNATWYCLYVNDSSGNRIDSWYTAAQANCAGGSGSCTATPNIPLDNGAASWWIQTYNSYGYGPWSARMDFTVSGSSYGPPVAATLTAPTGAISTGTPTYRWSAVSNATWYGLWVNDGTGNRIDSWYTAAQANCAGGSGSCTATPNIPLDNGAASWWVQTYNSYGYGPWSTRMDFTVSGSSY